MKFLSDRLPGLAALAFFGVAVIWMSQDARIPREAFRAYSALNQGPEGLSLASAYLAERGHEIRILSRPLERSDVAPGGLICRVRPDLSIPPPSAPRGTDSSTSPGTPKDSTTPPEETGAGYLTPQEESFLRAGGRMILALDRSLGPLRVKSVPAGAIDKVLPVWPRVERLKTAAGRVFEGATLGAATTFFEVEAGPVLARRALGKGDVWLLSSPEMLQNRSLGEADHLGLLEELARGRRQVYFDESVHGLKSQAGFTEILAGWGLGPFLILGGVAVLVAFWRFRTRVGPEEDDHSELRVEAVDFVDSLAMLYHRALPRRQALGLYRQAFDQSVAVQTGLRGPALESRIRELLSSPADPAGRRGRDLSGPEFHSKLKEINEAFGRLENAKRPRDRRKAQGAG